MPSGRNTAKLEHASEGVERSIDRPAFAPASVLGVLTIVLGALLARGVPMNSDETFSFAITHRPLVGFLEVQRTEIAAMAPFHALLWIWIQIDSTDWWLRMLPVVGGALTIFLLCILISRWATRGAAAASCLVVLSSPFFQRYLVEVRTYSWLMALGVFLVLILDNMVRRDRVSDSVFLGVTAGLGLVSHVTFVVVIGSAVVAIAISRQLTRQLWNRLMVAALIASAVFAPALVVLMDRRGGLDQAAPAAGRRFVAVTSSAYGSVPTSAIILAGVIGLLIAVIVARDTSWPTVCLACMAVGPPLLLAVISWIGDDLYNSRYLAPVAPFTGAAAVMGYRRLAPARLGSASLAVVVAVSILAGFAGPSVRSTRTSEPELAANYLDQHVNADDVVIFEPSWTRIFVARYWGYRPANDPTLESYGGSVFPETTRALDEIETQLDSAPTIWLITQEAESVVLDRLDDDRSATTHPFGPRLKIVELDALGP